MTNTGYLRICVIAAIWLFIQVGDSRAQTTSELYSRIVTVKGHVQLINHPELGKTPANFMYLVFQRAGCSGCLVGAKTDAEGNYQLFLGKGRYKLIVFQPSSPVYDLIAPGQKRVIDLRPEDSETVFDIDLKLRMDN